MSKIHLSEQVERKFTETYDVEEYEILSDEGWVDIKSVSKTIPYKIYILRLFNGYELKCADTHIIFDKNLEEIYVKDLKTNDLIFTDKGLIKVKEIIETEIEVEMYDVEINSDNHRFYSNGILSHNSMTAAIFILHSLIFNKDKKSAILANKLSTAKEILEKVKLAYRLLPYWIQIGVEEWHKTSMQLENGCHCFASATSADAIVGLTVNGILYIDEYAKIRRTIIDAFLDTVFPTISASTESKIIVTSTSRGMNHFYELWQKAVSKRSDFFPVEVKWNEVPGRDEKFRKTVIKNKGEQHFQQEYNCAFLGSSSTLVKGSVLEMCEIKDPIEILKDGHYKIFTNPICDKTVDQVLIKGRTYSIGVDTAKGTGRDYSVANVFDITTYPFRQVAIYRVNDVTTRNFAEFVVDIGKMYNNAFIMVENNDIGQAVIDYIWNDSEYENLVNYNTLKRDDIGIRSTSRTKSLANDIVKQLMEDFKIEVYDSDTIFELSKYVELRPGKFGAEEGENDDCITAMIWAIFIIKTNYLEDDDIKDEVKDLKDEGEKEVLNDEPLDMRLT